MALDLIIGHGEVIPAFPDEKEHERDGEPRVNIEGDRLQNRLNPSMPEFSGRDDVTAAAQLDTGAMMQIGAAVASMRYASFARVILNLSVTGRMTVPTVRQLNNRR